MMAGDLKAGGLRAGGLKAGGLRAGDLRAGDLRAGGLRAGDLRAGDLRAGDVRAGDLRAGDLRAGDLRAGGLRAGDLRAGGLKAGGLRAGDLRAGVLRARNKRGQIIYESVYAKRYEEYSPSAYPTPSIGTNTFFILQSIATYPTFFLSEDMHDVAILNLILVKRYYSFFFISDHCSYKECAVFNAGQHSV